MPGRYQPVDDELLFRVITGAATETERETLGVWLQASRENVARFREVAAVLEALAQDEATITVPPLPGVAGVMARAKLAQGTRLSERRRPIVGLVTIGLTAAIVATGVVWEMRSPGTLPPSRMQFGGEHLRTGPGNSTAVTLKDGTLVEIGPQSSLTTELRDETREVLLDGRASFQVAHQGNRPFVVRTSAGEVRDIGTQFTVRAERRSTQVAVFEGRVGFSNSDGSAEAGAGELIASRPGRSPVVTQLGAGHSPSDWVRAALVFEGTTVDEIARVIERHYGTPVRIADRDVGRRTLSAWFVQEPSLEEVFTAVCRAVDATCSVAASGRVISQ